MRDTGEFLEGKRAGTFVTWTTGTVHHWLPLLLAAGLWELCAWISGTRFFPHIHSVVVTLVESTLTHPMITAQGGAPHGYAGHAWITLRDFLLCLTAGSITGFTTVLGIFQWQPLRRMVSVALEVWEVVPPLLAVPVAFALFGVSPLAHYLAGAFYAFVATSVLTMGTLNRVPATYVNLGRLAGASAWWISRNVYVPAGLADCLGSLKSIGAFTLGIVVVLEYLAAPAGIGRVMKFAMSYHSIELLLVGVLWAILIGICFDMLVDLLTRRCLKWTTRWS
jgi:ABC-type nitrate/sulfonate/bicarbonate transport system permease component